MKKERRKKRKKDRKGKIEQQKKEGKMIDFSAPAMTEF